MITTKCINGNIHAGDLVISTPDDEYSCLIGRIKNINLLGTPEHEAETANKTDDVHVNFFEFDYSKKRRIEIAEQFTQLYGEKKKFYDCPLDDVVMAPCCLIRITDIDETLLNYLLQSGYNAACYCYGILSGLTSQIDSEDNPIKIELAENKMKMLNYSDSEFKITRMINGKQVDIELTGPELYNAFYRQERNFHVADIKTILEKMEDDEELGGYTAEEIYTDEILMGHIISDYEDNKDEYNMEWHDAASEAIKDNITTTEQTCSRIKY